MSILPHSAIAVAATRSSPEGGRMILTPMVPRSRRHRCARCNRRYNGMGGVCPGCTTISPERVAEMVRKRREAVKRARAKVKDPGCLALREANIDPPTAAQTEAPMTKIKNRWTGAVLYEGEGTLRDVVLAAVAAHATLTGATLARATLTGAYLAGANLTDAKVSDSTRLPQGVTWREFVGDVVPALLMATGKPLAEAQEHFACHTWENCPMAWVFGATSTRDVPAVWRPWADEFIRWFDAEVLTWEQVAPQDTAHV